MTPELAAARDTVVPNRTLGTDHTSEPKFPKPPAKGTLPEIVFARHMKKRPAEY